MHHQVIKSAKFFQHLLYSRFRGIKSKIVDTGLLLSICHLFGLDNPNQIADALPLPKAGLYRDLHAVSLYHWKCLNVRLGCAMAVELIKDTEAKSAATQFNTRIVSKQGRGNTDKPSLFIVMIQEVLDFFDAQGIDIRKYPITFDAWYGSRKLVNILSDLGFVSILVHGPSNYVMTIANKKAKLSVHKKSGQLQSKQWGCDKPVYRVQATSFNIW